MLSTVALRNLRRNPRRTLVTLLTVAMGTGALFIMDGFNAGIMNQYRDNTVHARFGHGQLNTLGYRDSVREKPWESWIDDVPARLAKLEAIPELTHVFPRIEFFGLLTNEQLTVAGRGIGVVGPAESAFFHTLNVVEGENLTAADDGVVLGIGLARSLGVKPGDRVTVLANTVFGSMNGADLRVSGIFHTGLKDVDDTLFRMQLARAQKLLDTQKVESIALGLRSHEDWQAFAAKAKSALPDLEATPFEVLDKVYYQHAVDWLGSQFLVIQAIILVIVVLGIMNTVSFTILERKQEIGNLRANGESVGEILALLLWEAAALGLLGALLGVAAAYALNASLLEGGVVMPPAPGLTRQYAVLIELQPRMAVTAVVLGVVAAVLSTVAAGSKVARMPIGEALRSA